MYRTKNVPYVDGSVGSDQSSGVTLQKLMITLDFRMDALRANGLTGVRHVLLLRELQ